MKYIFQAIKKALRPAKQNMRVKCIWLGASHVIIGRHISGYAPNNKGMLRWNSTRVHLLNGGVRLMQYVLKCRWISGEQFGLAQDKWWPGNWGGEGRGRERQSREWWRGTLPSKCAPKQSLSHTLSSRTHISLETSRSRLQYRPTALSPYLPPSSTLFPIRLLLLLLPLFTKALEKRKYGKHEMLPSHHTASQTCVKHAWGDAPAPVYISSNGQCDWLIGMWTYYCTS